MLNPHQSEIKQAWIGRGYTRFQEEHLVDGSPGRDRGDETL